MPLARELGVQALVAGSPLCRLRNTISTVCIRLGMPRSSKRNGLTDQDAAIGFGVMEAYRTCFEDLRKSAALVSVAQASTSALAHFALKEPPLALEVAPEAKRQRLM